MNLQNRNRGFTLVEMMVALGVGGIVMSTIVAGITMTFNQRKLEDQKIETSLLFDRINLNTSKPATCAANLANAPVSTTATPVTIDGLTEGSSLGKGFTVKTLKMITNTALGSSLGGSTARYPAYIQIQTAITVQGVQHVSRMRTLPIHVVANTTGPQKVSSCNADSSDQMLCEQNGGTWNATLPVGLQCAPGNRCLYGGSFSLAPNAGFVNRVTGAAKCQPGFTAQKAGEMSIASKNGKYGVANTIYPVYNCTLCGNQTGSDPSTLTSNGTDATDAFTDINAAADDAYSSQVDTSLTLESLRESLGLPAFP